MTQVYSPPTTENPFATRHVRPGKIPYLFPAGYCVDDLLRCLQKNRGWGEIIGPHGSGKSTLLETLVPLLESRGKTAVQFSLHDRQRKLPVDRVDRLQWDHQTQVIVDGFEQLSWWNRGRLMRFCSRRGVGLLVTAHQTMGLPSLYQSTSDREIFLRIVEHLIQQPLNPADRQVALDMFDTRGGDARESLFDLYDLYERRRS